MFVSSLTPNSENSDENGQLNPNTFYPYGAALKQTGVTRDARKPLQWRTVCECAWGRTNDAANAKWDLRLVSNYEGLALTLAWTLVPDRGSGSAFRRGGFAWGGTHFFFLMASSNDPLNHVESNGNQTDRDAGGGEHASDHTVPMIRRATAPAPFPILAGVSE